MKPFQAIAGAIALVLAAGAARPAGAENVLRWVSATEPNNIRSPLGQSHANDRCD
jgi:hypothetical protein